MEFTKANTYELPVLAAEHNISIHFIDIMGADVGNFISARTAQRMRKELQDELNISNPQDEGGMRPFIDIMSRHILLSTDGKIVKSTGTWIENAVNDNWVYYGKPDYLFSREKTSPDETLAARLMKHKMGLGVPILSYNFILDAKTPDTLNTCLCQIFTQMMVGCLDKDNKSQDITGAVS